MLESNPRLNMVIEKLLDTMHYEFLYTQIFTEPILFDNDEEFYSTFKMVLEKDATKSITRGYDMNLIFNSFGNVLDYMLKYKDFIKETLASHVCNMIQETALYRHYIRTNKFDSTLFTLNPFINTIDLLYYFQKHPDVAEKNDIKPEAYNNEAIISIFKDYGIIEPYTKVTITSINNTLFGSALEKYIALIDNLLNNANSEKELKTYQTFTTKCLTDILIKLLAPNSYFINKRPFGVLLRYTTYVSAIERLNPVVKNVIIDAFVGAINSNKNLKQLRSCCSALLNARKDTAGITEFIEMIKSSENTPIRVKKCLFTEEIS
jgi:hypothetical protein